MLSRSVTKLRVVVSSKLLPLAEASSIADAGGARQHSLLTNPRVQTASRRIISSTVRRMVVSSLTDNEAESLGIDSNFRAQVLNQSMDIKDGMPTIIVAGAAGQLGRKIYTRLINTKAAEYVDLPLSARPIDAMADTQGGFPTRFRIILMDSKPCPSYLNLNDVQGHEVEYIQCDFTKFEKAWADKFSKAYVAFLLATKVHFPSATSDEAYDSMLINANLLEACIAGKVERVVIGSSTDVVRGRVQAAVEDQDKKTITEAPGIDPESDPEIADQQSLCGGEIDSRLYAAAKVAAEAQARAMVSAGHLNRVIVLRLGACYPVQDIGPNDAAKARLAQSAEHSTIIDGDSWLLEWFKQVQLKDEDLDHIVDCCVTPSLDSVPEKKMIFVNAVSSTKKGAKLRINNNDLGYVPPDEAQSQHPPPA